VEKVLTMERKINQSSNPTKRVRITRLYSLIRTTASARQVKTKMTMNQTRF
jgi:hypothetical protein